MPHVGRRTAVAGGIAAVSLTAWNGVRSDQASAAMLRDRLMKEPALGRSAYAALVGQVMSAASASGVYRLRLVKVIAHAVSPELQESCFTLSFESLEKTALSDDLYTVSHPEIAPRILMLNSFGTDGRLQAVIVNAP